MMTATTELTSSLQALIDCRLDTIDRMLLGRVGRPERLAIVKEVETQIHDHLQECQGAAEELTREDVLAVLARLDPPEAYLPDEFETPSLLTARPPMTLSRTPDRTPRQRAFGRASGILGITALVLVFLLPLALIAADLSSSELFAIVILAGFISLAFIVAVIGLILGLVARAKGAWAITGIATAGVATLLDLLASSFFLLMIIS